MMGIRGVLISLCFLTITLTLKVKIQLSSRDRAMSQAYIQEVSEIKLMVNANGSYIYPEKPNLFEIPPLGEGVHIVQAISNQYLFPVLMIDKRGSGAPKMKWLHPLDRKLIKSVSQPILVPIERIKYFDPESGFSLIAFMTGGNGMFVMMGILMVICYKAMPKLDEVQMAPPQQQQRPN